MTKKPRIIKKVEELSDEITKAATSDNELREAPQPIDGDDAIYWPDFRVSPKGEGKDCMCFYGGESIMCHANSTLITYESGKQNNLSDRLYDGCVVRKHAEIFLKGIGAEEQE